MSQRPRDPVVHARFLDYRERHTYFGRKIALLSLDDFEIADKEHRELDALGEKGRDDEQEARFEELSTILFRD